MVLTITIMKKKEILINKKMLTIKTNFIIQPTNIKVKDQKVFRKIF